MTDQTPPTNPESSPKAARPQRSASIWGPVVAFLAVSLLAASLFTLWTPTNIFSNQLLDTMLLSLQEDPQQASALPSPTPLPSPRIGIVSGHAGNDPGSTCQDGYSEAELNAKIATLVSQKLKAKGYTVDLLKEFDPRLQQYEAAALVSIHNDSCTYINDEATGFKVAAAPSTLAPQNAQRLTDCLVDRYQAATKLKYHPGSITVDMTKYHAFEEINSVATTAAIIETGFMWKDRDILTKQTDLVAQGVANGIICFVNNESVKFHADQQPTETPAP